MYFDEVEIGFSIKTKPVKMEKEKMIAFAKLYNKIPLHTNEEFAKTTRFKGLIAPGLYVICEVYGEFSEDHIWQDSHIVGDKVQYDFPAPVYPGDVVRGVFTVTDKKSINEKRGIIEETMEIYNQNNVLVIKGKWNKHLKTKPSEDHYD